MFNNEINHPNSLAIPVILFRKKRRKNMGTSEIVTRFIGGLFAGVLLLVFGMFILTAFVSYFPLCCSLNLRKRNK